jgi:GNAT superfamily N-acetyltransferase
VTLESKNFFVRCSELRDIPELIELCKTVYPSSPPWDSAQLASHQKVFPQGQLTIIERSTQRVIGFAASLIVFWEDYDASAPWRDFTDRGFFTNHDPASGKTLYGAEIMIHPDFQGQGAGKLLYKARAELARSLGLLRIRAGARLSGYSKCADSMDIDSYVLAVVKGELGDPTLSFQLKQGFHVLRIISGYLVYDPESLGYAALIEWINSDVAKKEDYDLAKKSRFIVSL